MPAILFITTAASGAATAATTGTNIFLSPAAVKASLNALRERLVPHPGRPTPGARSSATHCPLTVGFWMAPYAARYGIGDAADGRSTAAGWPRPCPTTSTAPRPIPWPPAPSGRRSGRPRSTTLHPQVVALVIGWWDSMDRFYQGRWQHLGEPSFDAYETRAAGEGGRPSSSSGGAPVALMTSPYYDTGEQLDGQPWDEDCTGPGRTSSTRSSSRWPPTTPVSVSVVPLNQYLDPEGHFTWTINGKVVRLGDGVHTTPAAGPYLAPKILPQLAAMGRASRVPATTGGS